MSVLQIHRQRPVDLEGQDGKSTKIKMGTRSIAGKGRLSERSSPRHTAIDDVTLDHLMYLKQSLRKDAPRPSPSDSIPSSVTSSSYRHSEMSPRHEEWHDPSRSYSYRGGTSGSSSDSTFTGSRASSRGEDIGQEGGGESSSDFLLSGVEYYDLESIQEFPQPSSNYVTMLEEKTRRFQVVSASKCPEPMSERHISSLYRKRSDSSQSVDGGMSRHSQQQNLYGMAAPPMRPSRNSSKALSRHHKQHHATDSKLTEAAIRVLEMIEDFRMEEAMARSGRMVPYRETSERHPQVVQPGPSANYPSSAIPHDAYMPRYRKSSNLRTGVRPASTGSLMEHEIDARSVASASSYAASAEHHVYEEIMYDLVCERAASERSIPPPIPPDRSRVGRSRLLPVPPHVQSSHHQQQLYAVDPRRVVVRSHHKQQQQQRSSNLYSMLSNVHGRRNVDRFLEMEWHLSQERRDNLPPDFPV